MSLIFNEVNGVLIVGTNESVNGNGISDSSFSGVLSIPEFFNSKRVVEIGQYAFRSCLNLEEVIIQAKLVSINQYAFNNCPSLSHINIPPSVTFIGAYGLRSTGSGTAPGSLTIMFEGESQLSVIGINNFMRKDTIIIYFCGYGPISFGSGIFNYVNTLTIYSSTVSTFLSQNTINGTCLVSEYSYQPSSEQTNMIICDRGIFIPIPILISSMLIIIHCR